MKCFRMAHYQSSSERSRFLEAVCNVYFLLLWKDKASHICAILPASIAEASHRSCPKYEGSSRIEDLINVGHMGPIFSSLVGADT